jgi:hypothetical protein
MNTEIEYLQQLETDLNDVAAREQTRIERAALQGAIRRNAGRKWTRVAGAAASFLVVAGAIGFVVSNGMDGADTAGKFSQVGSAVSGAGGGNGASPPQATSDDVAADRAGDQPESVDRQQRDLSKIIRDGRIGIVVPDGEFGNAVGDLNFIAEQHGGFVLSSATQNERSGTFVLRIPARRFDRAITDIRDLATRVRFQEISGDDVTAEFIDFQARLRILRARKALLFDLFQQANTTEEILRLAGQLDDVQLRIEQIQGQLTFIKDQVAESTLRVSIQERNAPKQRTQTQVDNPDLGSSFDLGIQGFLRIVGAVIVGLGYLIPLTVLGMIVWFAVWFARRRRAIS